MSKRILIIEDDRSIAKMVREFLRSHDFEVVTELDGEWGLRTLSEQSFDLVLLDLLLPKLDGFGFLRRLREQALTRDLPVIVWTGMYAAEEHEGTLREQFGVLGFFEKPFELPTLLAGMQRALGMSVSVPPRTDVSRPESMIGRAKGANAATIPLRGHLEEISFARILGALFSSRSTGTLLLRKSAVKKIVHFKKGVPVFAKSNLLHECLGRVLVHERLITQEQCERSLELRKGLGKKQGQILVEMGAISAHNLDFALELQMQSKLFEVFGWLEGRYQFEPQEYDGPQVVLTLSPAALIHEGATRAMSVERIVRDLEELDRGFVVRPLNPVVWYQARELDPQADLLLSAVDGKSNLREVLARIEADRRDRAALLFYALRLPGLLDVQVRTGLDPRPGEDPQESAAQAADLTVDAAFAPTAEKNPGPVEMLSTQEIDSIAALASIERPAAVEPSDVVSSDLEREVWAGADRNPSSSAPDAPSVVVERRILARQVFRSLKRRVSPFDPDHKNEELRRELSDRLERMQAQNHYEILGLNRYAGAEDIEAAHAKLSREHHPERVAPGVTDREIRAMAEEIFVLLRRAFDTLSDDVARRRYDASLGEPSALPKVAPWFIAEAAFERGKRAAANQDWTEAEIAFAEAVEHQPGEAEYIAELAWAIFRNPHRHQAKEEALQLLTRAIDRNPSCISAQFYLGTMLAEAGEDEKARVALERVLSLDPEHAPARAALDRLGPPPEPSTPGFFSRFARFR